MASILTKTTELDINTTDIEEELRKEFDAEIIRWAIVSVKKDKIKICCSFKK